MLTKDAPPTSPGSSKPLNAAARSTRVGVVSVERRDGDGDDGESRPHPRPIDWTQYLIGWR